MEGWGECPYWAIELKYPEYMCELVLWAANGV